MLCNSLPSRPSLPPPYLHPSPAVVSTTKEGCFRTSQLHLSYYLSYYKITKVEHHRELEQWVKLFKKPLQQKVDPSVYQFVEVNPNEGWSSAGFVRRLFTLKELLNQHMASICLQVVSRWSNCVIMEPTIWLKGFGLLTLTKGKVMVPIQTLLKYFKASL